MPFGLGSDSAMANIAWNNFGGGATENVEGSSDWWTNTFNGKYADQKFNSAQAALDRQWNSWEAQQNRNFQEQMSSTAIQRGAADARAAGLNPYMAVSGMSASTPAGSVASASGARSSGSSGLGGLVNSALRLASLFLTKGGSEVARSHGRKYFDSDGVFRGGYEDF